MTDESQPHPDSPHQKMLDFLTESDQITSNIVPVDPDWPKLEEKIRDYVEDGRLPGA
jgi:hypothetical protein